ncbi:MAG TPA: class I SAM-dependent methyltransferase [Anaerolineales bacterium]
MPNDSYRDVAGIYDRLFDSMNKGLRLVGIHMFRPAKGMSILDVGCGTGAYLDLYRRYQCHLYGLDASPSMLEVARRRLADAAQLERGDATRLPYESDKFDLVISMLTLHEMSPETRAAVMGEIKRVLKRDGRILLIDFHPGPYQPLQGWISRAIILLSEVAAGWKHFSNQQHFVSHGGLPALAVQHGLRVEKQSLLAGDTLAVQCSRTD